MGSFNEAINQLLAFVKKYPNFFIFWQRFIFSGLDTLQQKEYAEVIENYRFMLDVYPSSSLIVQAQYSIGDSYYNLENYEAAITAYKQLVEKYPSSPLAADALRSMQYV